MLCIWFSTEKKNNYTPRRFVKYVSLLSRVISIYVALCDKLYNRLQTRGQNRCRLMLAKTFGFAGVLVQFKIATSLKTSCKR